MEMDVGGTSVSDGEGYEDNYGGNSGSRCELVGASGSSIVGKLKRSSSAPMINQLLPQGHLSAPSTPSTSNNIMGLNRESSLYDVSCIQPRARRLSANFGPVSPLSPGSSRTAGRMRVCQLKEEESMDIVNREAAHERTVHSSLQVDQTLSQSWEELVLNEERKSLNSQASSLPKKDYSDQLSLTITSSTVTVVGNSQGPCGASPTRVGRQCFSPSLQQPVRNHSFCPSPSPTKKTTFTTRRSVSPISLRPSALVSLKRKCDIEESFITPNKRLSTCAPDRCSGGLLITHPHSLESTPSPAGGGSLGSVGTPDSVCSSESPGPLPRSYSPAPTPDPPPHLFKPVSPALTTSHGANYGHVVGEQSENFMSVGGRSKAPSIVEGSDTSLDAMITEDAPMTTSSQDLKSYQDMDLSESQPQETLNI